MKQFPFKEASFIKSAIKPDQYPFEWDEIVFVGRSNVGKSSLLNDLVRQKHLAKTSSVPGKTQLINFFLIDKKLLLTDLPGFGFAQVSSKIRASFAPMMQQYFQSRHNLKVILYLFDVRRDPTLEDIEYFQWIQPFAPQLILVLTKTDKLSQSELLSQKLKIQSAFKVYEEATALYSVLKKKGRLELISKINQGLYATS